MAARSAEKSSFTVACNLLSNYIKQKGDVADLGLVTTSRSLENSKGEAETIQKPAAMDLLPAMVVSSPLSIASLFLYGLFFLLMGFEVGTDTLARLSLEQVGC